MIRESLHVHNAVKAFMRNFPQVPFTSMWINEVKMTECKWALKLTVHRESFKFRPRFKGLSFHREISSIMGCGQSSTKPNRAVSCFSLITLIILGDPEAESRQRFVSPVRLSSFLHHLPLSLRGWTLICMHVIVLNKRASALADDISVTASY